MFDNFKSYAGEQEIGPFHKRFSSVVGPNGSGKSNVIDALLFVFGKRAKQLRLSKVSELIHKSSRFPDLQYAQVSVHFQLIYDDESSADGFEVVPDSSFVVTRTAYKDNTSTYTVNGKSSESTIPFTKFIHSGRISLQLLVINTLLTYSCTVDVLFFLLNKSYGAASGINKIPFNNMLPSILK